MININYKDLINIMPKKNFLPALFLVVFIILIIASFNVYIYSTEQYYASKVYDNIISIDISYENKNFTYDNSYIKTANFESEYKILKYGTLYENNGNYFQKIFLKIDNNILDNEVVKFTLYYKKERIIEKMFDFISN